MNQKQKSLPDFHKKILSVVPVGKRSAIPISYMIDKLGLTVQDRRKVSMALSELIFEYGYPIGSSSDDNTKGVFLIENEDDLRVACRTLNSRATQVLKRHRKIIENFNDQEQIRGDFVG
ncbi:hypothetical protein [Pseudogracilibacillus auburnensis]|uniref:hypothetical protein n=1 Tax=Pseudogracilibacillus auburnensis TaxID=1494959 RepID=UPI001A97AEF8|nr:hypothetical protein [Pseudogracilibacillus auburnensis]MBO1005754.1 hypothetical protein [Pseudogracilibacillus auburnensis]